MVGFAVIAFALLVTGMLFIFFLSAMNTGGLSKRKRETIIKPKRGENHRLVLDEDGELIEFDAPAKHRISER